MTTSPSKPHLSFSQLSMFLRCSMQYWFRYVEGIIERPKLAPATGTGGHSALEWNSRMKMDEGHDALLADLVDKAHTEIVLNQTLVDRADYKPGEDPGKMRDTAVEAIKLYRLRDAPSIYPSAVELPFDIEIEPTEQYPTPIRVVNGRIDLVTDDLIDNKFPRQRTTQDAVDMNIQLTTYDMATASSFNIRRLGLRQFGGTVREGPFVTAVYRQDIFMTPAARASRIERVKNQFRAAEAQIRAGIFIPVDDPRVCSWCGYNERCQAPTAVIGRAIDAKRNV